MAIMSSSLLWRGAYRGQQPCARDPQVLGFFSLSSANLLPSPPKQRSCPFRGLAVLGPPADSTMIMLLLISSLSVEIRRTAV